MPTTAGHLREALADENRRMRKLRLLVDLTAVLLRERPLTRAEAEQVVDHLRIRVLLLFPGRDHVYDLIYRPRFQRIIEERFGREASSPLAVSRRLSEA